MLNRIPALLLTVASPALLTGSPPPVSPDLPELTTCAAPPADQPTRIFYADAQKGDDGGDGSARHPWRSLNAALPRLRAGDALRLRDGDYGPLLLQNRFNPATITIEADIEAGKGAHPHIDRVIIGNASHWRLRGLTIALPDNGQPLPPHSYLVWIGQQHSEIRLENNRLESYPKAGWSQQDYLARTPSGIHENGWPSTGCVYLSGNRLSNVSTGIASINSRLVFITGNQIDRFLHDGIDFGSSHMVITDNRLTNRINAGDAKAVHPDFMQGQPPGAFGPTPTPVADIRIERNFGIVQTTPDLPFAHLADPSFVVQGINIFDGDWTRVVIRNNVIITHAFHGITLMGAHDSQIVNNTVISDGSSERTLPWIGVYPSKPETGSTPSSNVLVANNISSGLHIEAGSRAITVAHNLVLSGFGKARWIYWPMGKDEVMTAQLQPGAYGAGNVIDPRPYAAIFRRHDPATASYDARLKAGPPMIGAFAQTR
ncbi:right-handed parallel beta-helix repeat-containing protein [Novosphingobium umbonatum]|uniref:Right-handed parallel beta-helix repeat-containing protein n=1 Tax=Novosphingobium umbonatum TaxID=1908524 RepID=A0A3S3TSJ7_9SPHN|nr:right-handed parallel beta-helix repeat-containing protein [Novosphingobium umbonatum]RVU07555.1 right-handed parallel beta-helix repeat-containing protein [Novosphingobium umbonatum]